MLTRDMLIEARRGKLDLPRTAKPAPKPAKAKKRGAVYLRPEVVKV